MINDNILKLGKYLDMIEDEDITIDYVIKNIKSLSGKDLNFIILNHTIEGLELKRINKDIPNLRYQVEKIKERAEEDINYTNALIQRLEDRQRYIMGILSSYNIKC